MATEPAQPAQPAQSAQPTQSAQSTQSAQPVQPAQPAQPAQPTIPQAYIDAANDAFAKDKPFTDDLRPGTFFDDPNYLDSLPHKAKALICAVQHAGDHPDRPGLCHIQSDLALAQYIATSDDEQLTMAFALEALSLRYVPAAHPGRGKSNHHMGRLYQRKWETNKDVADLNEAIRHYKVAADIGVETDAVLSEWACDVAVVSLHRYSETNQDSDKEEACLYFDRAIGLAGHSATRARHLSNKGEFLYRTVSGSDEERVLQLTESISCHNQAIDFCDENPGLSSKPHAPYGMIHRNAARTYLERFTIQKNTEDFEKSIMLFEKALTYENPGSHEWELFTSELAIAHSKNAQITGDVAEEEKGREIWLRAIERAPTSITLRIKFAEFCRDKADRYSDRIIAQDSLSRAVALAEDAVKALPPGHTSPGQAYACCASMHYSMYEFTGELSDINRAVECAQQATQDEKNENLWDYYRLLGQILVVRYERLKQPQDMLACISAAMSSFSKCRPNEHENQSHCLWVVGKATRAMYDSTQLPELLRKVTVAFAQASQLMKKDLSSRALVLNDLGNTYSRLFSHEALPEHLEKAIEAYKEALQVLQQVHKGYDHADILMLNAALGYVMIQRYIHWRSEADIESAVKYYRQSLLHIDEHHPRYAIRVGNLSYALQLRFDIKRQLEDLKETQRMLTTALEGPVSLSDDLKTGLATHVGNAYLTSFKATEQLSDLENAIDYYNRAIAVGGAASSASRGMAMTNKAISLKKIAETTGNLADFEASARAYDEAQQVLNREDPHYWDCVSTQAQLFYSMYERNLGPDAKAHGLKALDTYTQIVQVKALSPAIRITVASLVAKLYNDMLGDRGKARDYILMSLSLLPEAILMHTNRLEQLKFVREYQFVPSSVAALSIGAGDPPNIVIDRLEAGRAFIWDRIEGRPTQLDELEAANPELAGKFRTLQQRLGQHGGSARQLGSVDLTSMSPDDANRLQRQQDSDAYRQVLEQIRAFPQFGSFLKTPDTTPDLQTYAAEAPIVFINCSGYRSDALIIAKDNIYHLPLPAFDMERVKVYTARLLMAQYALSKGEDQPKCLSEYQVVMKWLWDAAAKPIVDSIDWSKYERGPFGKPRVIWVSTGWISVLPIHAAGDYESPSDSSEPKSVHDIAVSSYTNSLKALEFTRQSARRLETQPKSNPQALIAAMATTPGLGPDGELKVEPEIRAIGEALTPSFYIKLLSQPNSASVIQQLSTSTIAHFACHAQADRKDPSKSAVMLQETPTKPSPLSVRSLLKLNLQNCDLVYLSACESGASKDLGLRDEGIHIAGGFHIAGVPHVISTLWKVSDSVSAELAGLFYAKLKEPGRDDVDFARAPFVLHEAIREMRRRGVHPMLWGPFIHSGP
ncbi:CHAT domain-containing protein [Aspergillus floccosus]